MNSLDTEKRARAAFDAIKKAGLAEPVEHPEIGFPAYCWWEPKVIERLSSHPRISVCFRAEVDGVPGAKYAVHEPAKEFAAEPYIVIDDGGRVRLVAHNVTVFSSEEEATASEIVERTRKWLINRRRDPGLERFMPVDSAIIASLPKFQPLGAFLPRKKE